MLSITFLNSGFSTIRPIYFLAEYQIAKQFFFSNIYQNTSISGRILLSTCIYKNVYVNVY